MLASAVTPQYSLLWQLGNHVLGLTQSPVTYMCTQYAMSLASNIMLKQSFYYGM